MADITLQGTIDSVICVEPDGTLIAWAAVNLAALLLFAGAELAAWLGRRRRARDGDEAEPPREAVEETVATLEALIREVENEEGAILPGAAGSCRTPGLGGAGARVA